MLHFFLYSAMKKSTCHIIAQLIQIVEEGEEEVVVGTSSPPLGGDPESSGDGDPTSPSLPSPVESM